MAGPCLCGDPYCGACGYADAKYEAWIESFMEKIDTLGLDEAEAIFIEKLVEVNLPIFRELRSFDLDRYREDEAELESYKHP